MAADDELVAAIQLRLELDHQYVVRRPLGDVEGVEAVRSAGRRAGRGLGWKVRTFAQGHGDVTVVGVVVIESTPEDDARIRERGDLLLREAMKPGGLLGPAERSDEGEDPA